MYRNSLRRADDSEVKFDASSTNGRGGREDTDSKAKSPRVSSLTFKFHCLFSCCHLNKTPQFMIYTEPNVTNEKRNVNRMKYNSGKKKKMLTFHSRMKFLLYF